MSVMKVHQFTKNAVESVEVHLLPGRFGKQADIRIWKLGRPAEDGSQEPTERGFSLSVELLPQLKAAVDKAIEAAANT